MEQVKQIQCYRCGVWSSVAKWNAVAKAKRDIHNDVENEIAREQYFFRCPNCQGQNNLTGASYVYRYVHTIHGQAETEPYDGSTDTHPGNVQNFTPAYVVEAILGPISKPVKKSDLFANVLMKRAKEQLVLRYEIEGALARGDRETFMTLAKKYKEESEKPVALGGVECG